MFCKIFTPVQGLLGALPGLSCRLPQADIHLRHHWSGVAARPRGAGDQPREVNEHPDSAGEAGDGGEEDISGGIEAGMSW